MTSFDVPEYGESALAVAVTVIFSPAFLAVPDAVTVKKSEFSFAPPKEISLQ